MSQRPLTLSLVPGPRQTVADAWLIPGARPAEWVDALVNADAATSSIRLRIVADSGGRIWGVLVTGQVRQPSQSWFGYRCLSGGLYVPANSQLSAFASEAEIRAAVPRPGLREHVWHPTAGLIGYEAEQILRVSDLLRMPRVREQLGYGCTRCVCERSSALGESG